MTIYDAAMRYQAEGTPLVVLAGKEYGSGSSATGPPRARACSASRP
jgi:aconitase A